MADAFGSGAAVEMAGGAFLAIALLWTGPWLGTGGFAPGLNDAMVVAAAGRRKPPAPGLNGAGTAGAGGAGGAGAGIAWESCGCVGAGGRYGACW